VQVYISIGNSDDKLTQGEWAAFVSDLERRLLGLVAHGSWFSLPSAPWQNACWMVEVPPERADYIKATLRRLAGVYNQDSIAWAEADTEFLKP
jgi:hypothetical protein